MPSFPPENRIQPINTNTSTNTNNEIENILGFLRSRFDTIDEIHLLIIDGQYFLRINQENPVEVQAFADYIRSQNDWIRVFDRYMSAYNFLQSLLQSSRRENQN